MRTELAAKVHRFCGLCMLLLAPVLALGCNDTRDDPTRCYQQRPCKQGLVCNQDSRCVPPLDSGGPAVSLPDASLRPDGALPPPVFDTPAGDQPLAVDAGTDEPNLPVAIDTALEVAIDAGLVSTLDAEIDSAADVPLDLAIDTRVPDAPGSCSDDRDCDGLMPYCLDNHCVACKTSEACQGGTPICSASHICVACVLADAGCPAMAPACEADSGRCVECVSNDGCPTRAKPICDSSTNTCVPCTSDGECEGTGPGVCMFHLDGRCAADAETVYVGSTSSAICSDSAASAGSAAVPYCAAQKGVLAARAKGRSLVVITGAQAGGFTGVALTAPLTVVGKNATLTPPDFSDGIGITSGELYLRDLTVAGSVGGLTGVGVNAQASTGATLVLHIDSCTIRGNPGGGILLAGAAFDFKNSVVTSNGPGQTGAGTSFGGIRVDSLPASGPARLDLVTISNNLAPGLSCAAGIQGTGVLVSGNAVLNIATSCGVVSCATPSATCGAQ